MRKAILLSAIFLSACSNLPSSLPTIHPYKMDIQQGNVVTSKMMLQLRPGMSRAQVRYVMGTPLIADSFHANRWDYLYSMQKDGHVIEQRRVILDFEDDKLKRVRGDVVAASGNAAAPDQPSHEPVTLKPANGAAPKEKSVLDKLQFWKDDNEKTPAKSVQPAAEDKLQAMPPLMGSPDDAVPAAVPKEEAPQPLAAPAPKQEEKGLLDKLQFWKSDTPEKAVKPAAAPAPRPEARQLPAIADEKVEPLPPLTETPEPVLAKPEPKPAAAPAPRPAAETKPKPAPVQEPKPQAKPAPKPVAAPAEPKPAAKPPVDLPREGDPGYFEKMLEKIGF